MAALFIAGIVFIGLAFVARRPGGMISAAPAEGLGPPSEPSPSPRPVPSLAVQAGKVGVLAIAQQAISYAKRIYDTYRVGSTLFIAPSVLPEAGTVASDVLGTGALTTTAPDILLPTGEVGAEAAPIIGEATGETVAVGAEVSSETATFLGSEVSVVAGETVGSTIGLAVGFVSIGYIVKELINLGLNEYEPGSISKEIMRLKQIAIMQQGEAAMTQAIAAARDWPSVINILRHAPTGTSGQVQFGLGQEYAGEQIWAQAGTTETPGWSAILRVLHDATTLRQHPEVIVNFIANFWVQLGQSGATFFDGWNTHYYYRAVLLSKLPYNAEWNAIRQRILNMNYLVDPRNREARNAAIDDLPEMPADDFLRVGWAKLPTRSRYQFYNVFTTPPQMEPFTVEQAALQLAGMNPVQSPSDGNKTLVYRDGISMNGLGYFNEGTLTFVPIDYDPNLDPSVYPRPVHPVGFSQIYAGPGYFILPQYLDPGAIKTPIRDLIGEPKYIIPSAPVVNPYAEISGYSGDRP